MVGVPYAERIARPLGLGLVLALAFLVLAPVPARSMAMRANFTKCGDVPSLTTWDIRAKRVKCGKAKRVVRAYVAALVGPEASATQDVLGFHCKISGGYYDGAYYRCTAEGHRVIRFTRGG